VRITILSSDTALRYGGAHHHCMNAYSSLIQRAHHIAVKEYGSVMRGARILRLQEGPTLARGTPRCSDSAALEVRQAR